MSRNKHRNGKSRKSTSSSVEDEKVAGGHFLTKENSKRKESSKVHDGQQKDYPPPSNKDDPKSQRQFKKAVYRLSKKPIPEQRPVEIEVGCQRTKEVDILSRENTSSTQTESDPSRNTTSIPVDRTVDSGQPIPRSGDSKDTHHQTTQTTAKHGPHITSSQKGSSQSITPAEYQHKPPSVNTSLIPEKACKRKADTDSGRTTEQTASSSVKESTVRGGWTPLDEPHEDERGEPPGVKSSVRAPPDWTTKPSSTSKTHPTSDQKPKRPILTPGKGRVTPGQGRVTPGQGRVTPGQGRVTPRSPCVQGAGGCLTPQCPAVKFKIPKKTRPTVYLKDEGDNNNRGHNEEGRVSTQTTSSSRCSEPAHLKGSNGLNPKDTGPVQVVHSTAVDPFLSPQRREDGSSTVSHQPIWCIKVPPPHEQNTPDEGASITDDNDHEMQVVEAVHQARTERRLEVNVVQSYGELTRMDTDEQDQLDNDPFKNDLIVVMDTNILLSHLEYVKKIRSHGLGAMGFPVVLVPWVVLQELDSLKNSKRPEGSVAHLATPAVHFIYSCLKSQEPRLWGQSMQQASEGNRRLNAENNDDRILQCCLQYQTLHPESALILCTNDKNLCSKALLSGVRALCKADLEGESRRIHDPALSGTPTRPPTPLYPLNPTPLYPLNPTPLYPQLPSPLYPQLPSPLYPLNPSGNPPLLPTPLYPQQTKGSSLLPAPLYPLNPSGNPPLLPTPPYPLEPSGKSSLLPAPPYPQQTKGNPPLFPAPPYPQQTKGNPPLLPAPPYPQQTKGNPPLRPTPPYPQQTKGNPPLFPAPPYPQQTKGNPPLPPYPQQPSSRSSLGHSAPEGGAALPGPVPGDGGRAAQGKRLSLSVALLEDCLKGVLSHILEVEMKAAFDDLWEDIVYVKPPWEVPDVLQCIRKHWIAVFGDIVPRSLLPAVVHLCDFFTPGKTVEQDSVLSALRDAAELLAGFGRSEGRYGGRVSTATTTLNTIRCRLEAQPERVPDEPLVGDAMMSEEKQAPPLQVSHQEVWALFENIWANVCQISSALFAALHFDPGTLRRAVPEGAPPPPEDALACLHKLLPMVTQLLQGFSRVLSSDMGMEESQALLSFIHASQIVSIKAHLSTEDLVMCFSQQEYREKLKVGGAQLTELKQSLEHCVSAINHSVTNPSWL